MVIKIISANRRNNPTWVCKKYKNEGVLKCESSIIRERKLDELIGVESTLEDVYDTIFKNFCIGK